MSGDKPALVNTILSIPYLVSGTLFLGFKITLGMSICSASVSVEFIQFSTAFDETSKF
jgi:hypothetical protein